MTREEAITYLKVIWNRYKAEYEIERETLDAYHMAIEALSADAVSREAHYDAVANRITDMEERGFVQVVRCKECKWYYVINPKVERGLCEFEARPRSRKARSDSDFCSYGERSEV